MTSVDPQEPSQLADPDWIEHLASQGDPGMERLTALLRVADARTWLALDASWRARTRWFRDDRDVRSDEGARSRTSGGLLGRTFGRQGRPHVVDAGLRSMDADGHIREAAVVQLGAEPDPLSGPFLVLRAVDWVHEVATVAVARLVERLPNEPELVAASAPLVFALAGRKRRSDFGRLILDRAAADSRVRSALLASSDVRTRRMVVAEPAVLAAWTLDELARFAHAAADVVVAARLGAAAVARLGDPSSAPDDVLQQLLSGPPLARVAVLDALPAGAGTIGVAEPYLFDRSRAVRFAAQRAWIRAGADPIVQYVLAMSRGEQVPKSVEGIAALSRSAADQETVVAALRAPDPATRRAAVTGLGWLQRTDTAELLLPLLRDPSPGVTTACVRRLRARAQELDPALLRELAASSAAHQRRAAIRLLRGRGGSDSVAADLIGLADDDEAIRSQAAQHLRGWIGRASSVPHADRETRLRLGRRLDAVADRLPPDAEEELRFHAGLRPQDLGDDGPGI